MANRGSKMAVTMPSLGLGFRFRVREMYREIYIKIFYYVVCVVKHGSKMEGTMPSLGLVWQTMGQNGRVRCRH